MKLQLLASTALALLTATNGVLSEPVSIRGALSREVDSESAPGDEARDGEFNYEGRNGRAKDRARARQNDRRDRARDRQRNRQNNRNTDDRFTDDRFDDDRDTDDYRYTDDKYVGRDGSTYRRGRINNDDQRTGFGYGDCWPRCVPPADKDSEGVSKDAAPVAKDAILFAKFDDEDDERFGVFVDADPAVKDCKKKCIDDQCGSSDDGNKCKNDCKKKCKDDSDYSADSKDKSSKDKKDKKSSKDKSSKDKSSKDNSYDGDVFASADVNGSLQKIALRMSGVLVDADPDVKDCKKRCIDDQCGSNDDGNKCKNDCKKKCKDDSDYSADSTYKSSRDKSSTDKSSKDKSSKDKSSKSSKSSKDNSYEGDVFASADVNGSLQKIALRRSLQEGLV